MPFSRDSNRITTISNDIIQNIANSTDKWIKTVENSANNVLDPIDVTNLFCKDGILRGTVSRTIRKGYQEINQYFEYFARIPGLVVSDKDYNISKITNDVYVNNAKIAWSHDGITDPLDTRMTFIFRRSRITGEWCIYQLHSSELPEPNTNVKKINRVPN